ncbi:HNH endonuclease [Peptostreptococcus canis]|uniref:HNH nuclease domain-containing protein n=1 Tax=Peptostreptococcus canis TaxID=1159213 RepID=A0ABR6TJI1_9FIRM|nr:HNH endonuclease [Peptostreptococcus canis]MBC2575554.1 hypothetical protein [Peptostreptococcus canis]MBP1997250.1 hypothetical protein [Peptostreptococcus canis]
MPRRSKNKFDIVNNEIHITREGWTLVGLTTYREDYYEELTSKTWTLTKLNNDTEDKGYLLNGTLGLLHRYIVAKWYGEDVLEEMTEKGYVVDHMNNRHADCRISNLEFLKKAYNTAKGQVFDVDSKTMEHHIAVNIFKDFSTGCYQITIGCNDDISVVTTNGEKYHIEAILLLYDCDYSIVINDAENILRVYETKGYIDVGKTYACDVKVRKAVYIELTEEEKNGGVVIRNGVPCLVLETGKAFLKSVHYQEGWMPPKK